MQWKVRKSIRRLIKSIKGWKEAKMRTDDLTRSRKYEEIKPGWRFFLVFYKKNRFFDEEDAWKIWGLDFYARIWISKLLRKNAFFWGNVRRILAKEGLCRAFLGRKPEERGVSSSNLTFWGECVGTFFWKNAEEAIRRLVFPCAYVLLVQVGTQIFTIFLVCQVFYDEEAISSRPSAK